MLKIRCACGTSCFLLVLVAQGVTAQTQKNQVDRRTSLTSQPTEERTVDSQSDISALHVYVGTYTRGEGKGIYRCRLDLTSGQLGPLDVAAETENPSFLAADPSQRFLYATNEVGRFDGRKTGAVAAFAIDANTGDLRPLNQQPTGGAGPCHLVVDATGRYVLVANYTGGSIAVLPIRNDGSLGQRTSFIQHEGSSVDPKRQKGPHAHSITLTADNRIAIAADLGLDQLLVYRFDAHTGQLRRNEPPFATVAPGSGPRHFAFHPNGKWAYVINEMGNTITAFAYDPQEAAFQKLQTMATVPTDFTGSNWTAELQVHPTGKFLYGSNRGHDSIAIYRIDPATGLLTAVGHEPTQGKTPRNFSLDPKGNYLLAANQDSDSIVAFRIDSEAGTLQPTGSSLSVPAPVCVLILPR